MQDRASKLQDVVAHVAPVKSLKFGPKSGLVMVTGGDDKKVNLWTIGKTEPIMSLTGHASAVEAVSMDWPEELVVAGSNSGAIKLWDLDQAKVIRTLSSHKASITSLEFHPFGEFFASASEDYSVKIWDVRRKGCIQTYHGHQQAVRCLRISPDGRWIATGDAAGCVKIWDMTAGKLLRSYTPLPSLSASSSSAATAPVASICFNPAEFMMSVANTEGSITFYDLQTFDSISRCDAKNCGKTRIVDFDADGTCLMAIGTEGMQIWGYEPPVMQDSVVVKWGDVLDVKLLPDEGRMLVGSHEGNFVSIWSLDLSRVKPFADDTQPPSQSVQSQLPPQSSYKPPPTHVVQQPQVPSQQIPPQSSPYKPPQPHVVQQPQVVQQTPPPPPTYVPQPQQQAPIDPPESLPQQPFYASPSRSRPDLRESRSRPDLREETFDKDPIHGVDPSRGVLRERKNILPSATGDQPLNFDLVSFSDETQHRSSHPLTTCIPSNLTLQPIPRPTNEDDVVSTLSLRHSSFATMMSNRLSSVRQIRSVWDEDNIKRALDSLVQIRDDAVANDVLKIVNLKPSLLNLEGASVVLACVRDLLDSQYEEYICTACTTVRFVIKSFATLIVTTLEAARSSNSAVFGNGVNIQSDERIQRCQKCFVELLEIQKQVASLVKVAGKAGLAARDAKREIDLNFGEERG